VRAVFSARTRTVGLSFCLLWVLFFTGHLRPLFHFVAAHAATRPPAPRAMVASYLPWAPGTTARVTQGNGGTLSHDDPWNRYAWDFGLPLGTPLYSGLPGVVVFAAGGCPVTGHDFRCNSGYGNTVTVRAADETCARFAHLNTLAVYPGQVVVRGTPIGTVGSSGHATGPHLHYQREVCATGIGVPSSFAEAGVPAKGQDVTSALPVTG
jgi:murein DD-endopeptidase MepM/ murein hydrolase activator NlpD